MGFHRIDLHMISSIRFIRDDIIIAAIELTGVVRFAHKVIRTFIKVDDESIGVSRLFHVFLVFDDLVNAVKDDDHDAYFY